MMKNKIIASLILFSIVNVALPTLAQFSPDRPTFFRDGQELMEQEIKRLQQEPQNQDNSQQILEHPSQLLTIDDGKLRWQKYLFREGGFSVWMPEGIHSEETVVVTTNVGDIKFEVLTSHPKSLRFVAAYSADSNITKLGDTETILASVRDGIIAKGNFELIKDEPVSFQEYSGKQILMKDDNEFINFRIFLINKKVYVLAVSQKNADNLSEEITSFFESFRVLN